MEAVAGKTAFVGSMGFMLGAGFSLFKAADDVLLGRVALGTGDATPRAIARLAISEGARTAIGVGSGTAIALSVCLFRRGRAHPSMTGVGEPVGAFLGTAVGAYYLLDKALPARQRLASAVGFAAVASALVATFSSDPTAQSPDAL